MRLTYHRLPCAYSVLTCDVLTTFQVVLTLPLPLTLSKVVKFMRQLVPHEPRLAKKLVEPLLHLIQTTQAKSLQY